MTEKTRGNLRSETYAMIDLHSHILPGVDDGAATMHDAVAMLEIAESDGTEIMVATPHVPLPQGDPLLPEEILRRVLDLNAVARDHGIPLEVMAGSEIRCEPSIVEALQQGELLSLNGSPYVLLELPLFGDWPVHVRSTIYDLQLAGYMPVLAHVERYPAVQRDPNLLADLIATGVLLQVNASSIVPGREGQETAAARRLLDARMVHLIASDAHSPKSRAPRLHAAFNRVAEMTDADYAAWIQQAANEVITGDIVTVPEPNLETYQPWWRRFWPGARY